MFTDMVGFTALTQSDESQSLAILERHNKLLRPIFPKYRGREVKTIGDSFLVEFDSALDSTNCAVEVQRFLHDYNLSSKDEWKITLRIGVHLGDVVHSDGDVLGDAVNIASRLQHLAEPEGVCISQQVYDQVRNKVPQTLVKMEPHDMKGVRFAVDVYKVVMPWEHAPEPSTSQADTNRVAVLPFANMSPDPGDEYFADGITEEIITTLSGISALNVISRTSVMGYKGTTKKLREIGKELEVGSIIEGSFRKAGNRIRVTAQLIDVSNDRHLWAQNYDRQLDDIFAIQGEIASNISEHLKIQLGESKRKQLVRSPTKNMVAYEAYLKWIHAENIEMNWNESIKYLEEAISLDPDFSLAYALLGDFYVTIGGEAISWNEALENAQPLIARALELDENSSEAHTAKGNLALQHRLEFDLAEREFKRAIELNPSNSKAHFWYSFLHYAKGEVDKALKEAGIASRLDPLSLNILYNIVWYLRTKRDYTSAHEQWSRFLRLNPESTLYRIIGADLTALAGNLSRAETELNAALLNRPVLNPWEKTQLAYALMDMQKLDEAKKLLAEIEVDRKSHYYPLFRLAVVFSGIGEKGKAIEALEKDFEEIPFSFLLAYQQPEFDSVREDPRFKALLAKLPMRRSAT